jgi:hypothetical protein
MQPTGHAQMEPEPAISGKGKEHLLAMSIEESKRSPGEFFTVV